MMDLKSIQTYSLSQVLGSFIMAPFGAHAFNLATITGCQSVQVRSHKDPSKR